MKIMNATTIQIKDETLGRLKFFKEFNKESYDEIINKVLDEIEEGELTDEALKDMLEAKKEIREGKGQRTLGSGRSGKPRAGKRNPNRTR